VQGTGTYRTVDVQLLHNTVGCYNHGDSFQDQNPWECGTLWECPHSCGFHTEEDYFCHSFLIGKMNVCLVTSSHVAQPYGLPFVPVWAADGQAIWLFMWLLSQGTLPNLEDCMILAGQLVLPCWSHCDSSKQHSYMACHPQPCWCSFSSTQILYQIRVCIWELFLVVSGMHHSRPLIVT